MMVLWQLFAIFFKIGLFSFGGGYVMLPIIYHEIAQFHVLSYQDFFNVVAISQMTPGPIAVNAATYVGYEVAGLWGSVFATLGVVLPCFLLVLAIGAVFTKFQENQAVNAVLQGIRPATVGLIASATLLFANTSLFQESKVHFPSVFIFCLVIFGARKLRWGAITLTILGGLLGLFFG